MCQHPLQAVGGGCEPSAAVIQRQNRRNSTASLPKTRTQCGAVCCTFYRSAALSAVLSTAPTIAPSVHRTTSRSVSRTTSRAVGCADNGVVGLTVSCAISLGVRRSVDHPISYVAVCAAVYLGRQ